MIVFFDSKTGNVKKFTNKIKYKSIPIFHEEKIQLPTSPFILVTFTTKFGEVPPKTKTFLNRADTSLLRGVAVSGNKVWGSNYGKAGDLISKAYSVPLLLKFELAGMPSDVRKFELEVSKFE